VNIILLHNASNLTTPVSTGLDQCNAIIHSYKQYPSTNDVSKQCMTSCLSTSLPLLSSLFRLVRLNHLPRLFRSLYQSVSFVGHRVPTIDCGLNSLSLFRSLSMQVCQFDRYSLARGPGGNEKAGRVVLGSPSYVAANWSGPGRSSHFQSAPIGHA